MARFSDEQFLDAVRSTKPQRGQMEQIARQVGCSNATAIKRLRALAADERCPFEISKQKAYDEQPSRDAWGSSLFGGAAVCIRRYLIASMKDDDARHAQYASEPR